MTGNSIFLKTSSTPGTPSSVEAFLAKKARESASGRLIFALDATASRQPTWDRAAEVTSEMFREAGATGRLEMQLAYYRGGECKSSSWLTNAKILESSMRKISCVAGNTQIEEILSHAIRESKLAKVGALVFIGDAMEEDPDVLVELAKKLGGTLSNGTPIFMFQEGRDTATEMTFQEIARVSGGAFARFDATSASQLRDLLKAVALFATGGSQALIGRTDPASKLLLGQMKGKP
jgi:hypothetical protein